MNIQNVWYVCIYNISLFTLPNRTCMYCRASRKSIHSMKSCANISASLVRSNNPNEVTLQSNNATSIEGDAHNKQNAFSDTLVTCPLDNCAFSSCSLNGDMFDAKNLQPILRERCGNIFINIVPKIGARSLLVPIILLKLTFLYIIPKIFERMGPFLCNLASLFVSMPASSRIKEFLK